MDSTIDIKKLRDKTILENAGKLVAKALAKHLGLYKKRYPRKLMIMISIGLQHLLKRQWQQE